MLKILVIIPARGGSKGIPRKNVRFLCGKPLIAYAIQNAFNCNRISDVAVTTDDEEIADVAQNYGCFIISREKNLSEDAVPLDPVVYDAVVKMETKKNIRYDIVITLQPTSPLLTSKTLDSALTYFINSDYDSVLSVVNRPHLSWIKKGNQIVPDYEKRLNRQYLPPRYMETGAFLITKRDFVKQSSRLGDKVSVYEVPERESTDIDTVEDWIVCENILKHKKIIFRADGYKAIGMGHIYNCITMAFELIGHEVLLVTRADCPEGIKKIKTTNLPYCTITSDKDLDAIIEDFKPDIFVNDCLNTNASYMRHIKKQVSRLISIEDLGAGTAYADAVINALYELEKTACPETYVGEKYICLRNEFLIEKPKEFSEKVTNILIMFGGTDPSNLNRKLYSAIRKVSSVHKNISFNFVLGMGYSAEDNNIVTIPDEKIFVHKNVPKVSDFMKKADIAISSQGRTVYELSSMGIPSVILAQNDREMTHTFATMKNGFLNLGLGKQIGIDTIVNTLNWLIDTPNIRANMRNLMLKHDFSSSSRRIKEIILGEGKYE